MNDAILFDEIDEHGPQRFSRTYDIAVSELDRDEIESVGPVSIDLTVEPGNTPGEYLADGTVRFTADFTCARCVDPYPVASNSDIHIRFQPRLQVEHEGEEIELTEADELDVEFYGEREVPLRQLAIEQVELSIPMKPLCSDSCLGLCAQCGANLNRETCNCENLITDHRWTALQGIREQFSKKSDA